MKNNQWQVTGQQPALRVAVLLWLGVLLSAYAHRGDAELREAVLVDSLQELTVQALRVRDYHSEWVFEGPYLPQRPEEKRYVISYNSDGLRLYAGVAIPQSLPPAEGYPVVVFIHGWVGREAAPDWDFFGGPGTLTGSVISHFVSEGFVVLTPALRGHGVYGGKPAEGIEFLDAWDNGSYLSPVFYAIDVLNLMQGLPSIERMSGLADGGVFRIDLQRVNVSAHSQGGDAALMVLAISGEGGGLPVQFAAGSIIAGCFAPRFIQAETYAPMGSTLEAFMSGDGTWTGNAMGRKGEVNKNFVFGWPPDWIETVDVDSPQWTWQPDHWSTPTVAEALGKKYGEMYEALNQQVSNLSGAEFKVTVSADGVVEVVHDPRVAAAMNSIGAFHAERNLTEPLHLHFSDQDYYSLPSWNESLAQRLNDAGNYARAFRYEGNTHRLGVSEHEWFSGPGTRPGLPEALARDVQLFRGR